MRTGTELENAEPETLAYFIVVVDRDSFHPRAALVTRVVHVSAIL